jgi:hypothetical protein
MGDDATQNHGRYSQPCALFPSVANIAVHCRTIKEANALDLMETDMTMRLAIVLACTLLGLSACVVEPYGRGGERGGGYYNGGNSGHSDYYGGGGHGDDGQRDRH